MELKNFFAQDDAGNMLPGATCYLYERGTESLVKVLQGPNGLPLGNPFVTDRQGLGQFAAPNGLYDLRVVKDIRDYRIRLQFNDVTETAAAAENAARALQERLADPTSPENAAGMVGFLHQWGDSVARSLASKVSESISVQDYMTAAQIADVNSTAPILDHSAAFRKAFAAAVVAGHLRVHVNPVLGYYNVKNVAAPDGLTLTGYSKRPYIAFDVKDVRGCGSAIVMMTGAQSLFTWGAGQTLMGVVLHGRDRSQDAFKATGPRIAYLRVVHCGVYRFNAGAGNPSYIGGAEFIDSNFSGNTNGMYNLIDTRVIGGVVNANENTGVSCSTGANDNSFIGVKCEWNNGNNWEFFESGNNIVLGGITDRAGLNNFKIGSGSRLVIGGIISRRAGRIGVLNGRNFYIESAKKVSISNVQTDIGSDDNGQGGVTPANSFYLRSAIGQLTVTNVDMTGGTGTPMIIEAGTTFEDLSIRDCPGVKDYFDRPGDVTRGASVQALTSVNVPLKLFPVMPFGRAIYRVSISARNTSTGATILGGAVLCVQRESSNAEAIAPAVDWASGSFGVAGTETISISLVNVSNNGASAELSVKNNHATATYNVNCVLSRVL